MPEKKSNRDDIGKKVAQKGKKTLRKKIKNLHPATKVIVVICLILGIAAGAVFCLVSFKNDHFALKGETQFSFNVGDAPYVYTEEGVDAVCFGQDVSGKMKVEASTGVTVNADGTYTIPTDKEGVYTLTYTVDCFKFGENAPNGVIKRIRVFTVDIAEDDGRGEAASEEVAS